MKTKLQCTSNYDLFEMHDYNRILHDDPGLEDSLKKHGFMPSSPLHCKPNGNGKFKIIRGHHRFHYSKRLGLPVYYVVDKTDCDIFELEGGSGQLWSITDFAHARSRGGDKDYTFLLAFKKKHGLTMGSAASLVGGETAGSSNKSRLIKSGDFECGDMAHANEVVRITDLCRELKLAFATSTSFVSALSKILRVPDFDVEIFCQRLRLYPARMRKRSCAREYMDEIEGLYNHGARGKRIPVSFLADTASQKRKHTFGREG